MQHFYVITTLKEGKAMGNERCRGDCLDISKALFNIFRMKKI